MTTTITTVALLALCGGCKAKMSAARFPEPSGAATADYGDYGGADEASVHVTAERESAAKPPAAPASTSVKTKRGRRGLFGRRDARSKMASPSSDAPEPAVGNAEPEPADERPDRQVDARHIIYTAAMTVSVFNLEAAMEKAEQIPDQFGGYIQSMGEDHVVLRLPSKHLRTVMNGIDEYGVIQKRSLRAQDVTAEFTDVESRIRALEETHKQLLALLSKARNVEEALKVRAALDNINTELEVLKGRMRQLQNQITYSTLTLQFLERGPHTTIPSSDDPFVWINDLGVESTEWK